MATALFISTQDLKKNSIIDGNVDSDKIVQYIEIAQDIHIQNYLGGKLYKKLQTLIVNGTITDSANSDYKTLLDDYVKPMLIWYTQATYLPYSMFQISNGGMFKHRSENSDTVSKEEMDYIVQKAKDTAEFYTRRFMDYMDFNSQKYPEYLQSANENMHPDRDVNFGGIYLG